MTSYGYIGLGQMGAAMARRLVSTGHDVTVFDLSSEAVDALVELGATAAGSAADVARVSDIVSICVPAAAHLDAVLNGLDGIGSAAVAGQTILVHSTVAPESMRAGRDAAAQWGAALFDVCVAGGVPAAAKGEVVILAGGVADMSAEARAVLDVYGSLVVDCGPVGAGAAVKLAFNVMTYAQMTAAASAYSIVRTAGGDPTVLADAWRHTGQLGKLTEGFLPVLTIPPEHITGTFRQMMEINTGIGVKDLSLAAGELADDSLHAVVSALAAAMPTVYGVAAPPPATDTPAPHEGDNR